MCKRKKEKINKIVRKKYKSRGNIRLRNAQAQR